MSIYNCLLLSASAPRVLQYFDSGCFLLVLLSSLIKHVKLILVIIILGSSSTSSQGAHR